MSTTQAEAAPGAGRKLHIPFGLTLVALLVLLCVLLTIFTDSFMTERNIPNLARQGSMIAILALSLRPTAEEPAAPA